MTRLPSESLERQVYAVPPLGDDGERARDVLTNAGWTVLLWSDVVPDRPRPRGVFLVDATQGPDAVRAALARVHPVPAAGEGVLAVVDSPSPEDVALLLDAGVLALWDVREPSERLVERMTTLVQRAHRWRGEARLQAMMPLYRVAQFFADPTDVDTLLQHILETAIQETGADRGSIMLVEEESRQLYVAAAVGLPEHVIRLQRQPIGQGIAGWVAEHRQPLILTEGEMPPFVLSWLRGRNAYSSISVPMLHRGDVVGVLNLTKAPGRPPFQQGDAELVTVLAHQAAAAIRNARLFREIQDAYERLRHLDQLRTHLIDIAAHEMRTPVTVLKGYLELLKDMDLADLTPYLPAMLRSVQRLDRLVHDLFQLSTLEALAHTPRPRPVDVRPWAEGLLAAHQAEAQAANVRLRLEVAPDVTQAIFDPDHVANILAYLLNNAFKFTPPGGEVCVRVEGEGHFLHVHVDDSGPGIPEALRERVFDEFFQVEDLSTREHEGLGIGLTIARALARAHYSRLSVHDSPLGGARFTLTIPNARVVHTDPENAAQP